MPHKKSKEGYLSVTEVLSLCIDKPFLRYWFGKNGTQKCEQIKRESQELGIEVHNLIETSLKTGTIGSVTGNNADRMNNNFWNKFVIPYNVRAVKLEETYEDKKLKLQGTMDGLIEIGEEGLFIADWKTSNQIDKIGVPLQLSAYNYLAKGPGRGVVVRVDKESDKVEIKKYENLPAYWEIFKNALVLARYIKEGLGNE